MLKKDKFEDLKVGDLVFILTEDKEKVFGFIQDWNGSLNFSSFDGKHYWTTSNFRYYEYINYKILGIFRPTSNHHLQEFLKEDFHNLKPIYLPQPEIKIGNHVKILDNVSEYNHYLTVGSVAEVVGVPTDCGDYYKIKGLYSNNNCIVTQFLKREQFELTDETLTQPQPKVKELTVAEISKLLGYTVKIIE